jgi:hypothetical protein
MPDGEICIAPPSLMCVASTSSTFTCSLPATSEREAADFLEVIGSGGAVGTGVRMSSLGVTMPNIRDEYKRLIDQMIREVESRRAARQSSREIARWVVNERRRIANQMRWRSGPSTRVLFEVRDWAEYGVGGRSYGNLERRYLRRGVRGTALYEELIRGAQSPNTGISQTAIQGARYLRYGGRVILVISLATTAYSLLTASPDELERLLYEEAGGVLGGSVGTGLAVGTCLVFGVVSGGWGLLACGVIGGIGGGVAGTYVGNQVYYSRNLQIETSVLETGVLDANELTSYLPLQMCVAP